MAQVAKGAKNVQQDEYTTEMRAAALRAGFAHNQIAAIFANAIAAERKRAAAAEWGTL
jgi:hypothetical protein